VKALFWIGGIALVIAALVFGGMRLFSDLSARSDKAAMFADTVAATVTDAWDLKTLAPFADEAFYSSIAAEPAAWRTYALLGPAINDPKCRVTNIEVVNGRANALALCPGKFEKGSGTLRISVSDYSGEWRVTAFKLEL
jgi:hypothetical protein